MYGTWTTYRLKTLVNRRGKNKRDARIGLIRLLGTDHVVGFYSIVEVRIKTRHALAAWTFCEGKIAVLSGVALMPVSKNDNFADESDIIKNLFRIMQQVY